MPRNRGKHLERLLGPHADGRMSTHQLYLNRGEAIIRKVEVPMAKNRVSGQWVFAQRTSFDYQGVLRGGRYIGVEAKEIGGEKLQIAQNGLKEHQLNGLIRYHRMGALVGVLWMPNPDQCFWLPGKFLKDWRENHYEKPYKYIGLDTVCASHLCPQVMTPDGFIDYLGAALKERAE